MPKRLSVFTGESSVVWAAPLNAEFDNVYTVFEDQIDGINTEIDNINDELTDFYSGTVTRTGGSFNSNTDVEVGFGTGAPAHIVFSDANDCLAICLDTTSHRLLICEKGDETTALGFGAFAHPNVMIHSSDAGTANQYLILYHQGTSSVIGTGTGPIHMIPGGTNVSTFHTDRLVIDGRVEMSNYAAPTSSSGVTLYSTGGAMGIWTSGATIGDFTSQSLTKFFYVLINGTAYGIPMFVV